MSVQGGPGLSGVSSLIRNGKLFSTLLNNQYDIASKYCTLSVLLGINFV